MRRSRLKQPDITKSSVAALRRILPSNKPLPGRLFALQLSQLDSVLSWLNRLTLADIVIDFIELQPGQTQDHAGTLSL